MINNNYFNIHIYWPLMADGEREQSEQRHIDGKGKA